MKIQFLTIQLLSNRLSYRQLESRLFVGALALVVIAIATGPLNGQVPRKRNSDSGVVRFLKRLDRNRNEILDKDELVGNAASYLQNLGFDTSQPLSLNRVLRKIEGKQENDKGKNSTGQSSVVRKVPGFGVEAQEREGVNKFGGNAAGGIDMNAKYGERVMTLVKRTIDGYDVNKNGYLDPSEIKKARWGKPTPQETDTNHDGILTQVELADRYLARDRDAKSNGQSKRAADAPFQARSRVTTSRNKVRSTMPASSTSRQNSNGRNSGNRPSRNRATANSNSGGDRYARYAAGLMTQYDKNKDGKLSADELGKMRRPPKGADVNGDGFVTPNELTNTLAGKTSVPTVSPVSAATTPTTEDPQARAGNTGRSSYSSVRSPSSASGSRRPSGSFTDCDKNQDGQVQMHEFADDWDGEIFAQFQAKDSNGDGIITSEEWNGR